MINRRQFLQIAATGTAGLISGGLGSLLKAQPAGAQSISDSNFIPDVDISLKATPAQIPILPGNATGVWRFEGQVLHGDPASLLNSGNTYLGPTIRVHRGQRVRIRFTNNIPYDSIVHWHGLHVPAQMDGHPRYVIQKGEKIIKPFP